MSSVITYLPFFCPATDSRLNSGVYFSTEFSSTSNILPLRVTAKFTEHRITTALCVCVWSRTRMGWGLCTAYQIGKQFLIFIFITEISVCPSRTFELCRNFKYLLVTFNVVSSCPAFCCLYVSHTSPNELSSCLHILIRCLCYCYESEQIFL